MKRSIAMILSFLLLLGVTAFAAPRAASAAVSTLPQPETSAETEVIDALTKLGEVGSLHSDIGITMELTMGVSAEGIQLDLPIRVNMSTGMDMQTDPYLVKGDMSLDIDMGTFGSQSQHFLIYGANDGEKLVSYSSTDDGASWTTQENGSLHALLPGEAFDILRDHIRDIQKAGTETFQGAKVDVYTGWLEGKYMGQVISTTGMDGMISEITGGEGADLDTAELGDIPVTLYIDGDGYPVYYAMDMTEAMQGMLATVMQELMGLANMEGVEITMDISAIRGESTLSRFDAIDPIVIPDAILDKPTV